MKCDQFLACLESGNLFKRILARSHARRCRECRQAYSVFQNIKKALSETEPLTSHQKELWLKVAPELIPGPKAAHQRFGVKVAGGFVLAIGLLIAILFIQQNLNKNQDIKPVANHPNVIPSMEEPEILKKAAGIGVPQISEITEVTFEVNFSDLKQDILELEQEIKTQRIHAQLLDARKQIEILLAANQD